MTTEAVLLALALLAPPASAAPRKSAPAAEELLRAALAAPEEAFTARVRVQAFDAAGKAKAQYRRVCFRPPSSWRIEASAKRDGPLAFLRISDGKTAMTAWPKLGRARVGPEAASDAEAEAARLRALYDLAVSSGGRVAGKAAWRLDLRSKADGRVRRALWIGKTSGLLLRREDYRPDGGLLRRERVTRFDAPPDAVSFAPVAPAGATDAAEAPGAPRWVLDGFALLEASGTRGDGSERLAYTDGLATAVLLEAAPGAASARPGRPYAEARLRGGVGRFYAAGADGVRLVWSAGGRDFALAGDLPEADLARMADSIPEAP